MKVILVQDVKSLGRKGDVKEVADGYARNFLLAKGLAVPANAGNINSRNHELKLQQDRAAKELAQAQKQASELADQTVVVYAKAGDGGKLFGSVTNGDIADALAAMGYKIDKKKIEPLEPIKTLGQHQVQLKLYPKIQAQITVEVKDESQR